MLSLATPSSISRDLRTPSPRLSAVRKQGCSPASTTKTPVSPLVLPSADGELSKICGSLVEPENTRQQWSCHACKIVFPRDATIYIPPNDRSAQALTDRTSSLNSRLAAATSVSQEHYCRACYADRFALGQCYACTKPVLGSTKDDGKFVKSGLDGRIWHGRCWACTSCGTQSSTASISIGMDGTPTCETCFDMPIARRSTAERAMPCPSSPGKSLNRAANDVSASSLSGKATRQGMGAAIAELSRKFGQPVPTASTKNASPILPQHSGRQSPVRGLARSNSITGRARPLTAQFSGQSFNLAAFQPSSMHRSDSRSRSASPTKQMDDNSDRQICSRCFKGPFEGPLSSASGEARMVSLRNTGNNVLYHSECFRCAICLDSLESAARSFVRLEDGEFAHPSCAPPAAVARADPPNTSERPTSIVSSASSNDLDHATHQRLPRPTLEGERPTHNLPSSYLMAGAEDSKPKKQLVVVPSTHARPITECQPAKTAAMSNIRRFQPSSGAAPPTRSTLLQSGAASGTGGMNHASASLAVSSGPRMPLSTSTGRFGKLGGMQVCGGCDVAVSSLEGVPGPRGQSWHRKCLVCSAPPMKTEKGSTTLSVNLRHTGNKAFGTSRCGKQLDSSAKVTAEGQLRCRECYDREHARHRAFATK